MFGYDNGFARAQAQYDAQMPPEAPEDNRAKYELSGSMLYTIDAINALNHQGISFDLSPDGDDTLILFSVEEKGDIDDVCVNYEQIGSFLKKLGAEFDVNALDTYFEETEEDCEED
jgi:hypothetical protein